MCLCEASWLSSGVSGSMSSRYHWKCNAKLCVLDDEDLSFPKSLTVSPSVPAYSFPDSVLHPVNTCACIGANKSLLGLLLHALLDPGLAASSCCLEFFLSLLPLVESLVWGGHVATLLEAGTLEELENPFVEVGELGHVNASPLCSRMSVLIPSLEIPIRGKYGHVLAEATHPQHEMSAMVRRSPTRKPDELFSRWVSMVR